LREGGGGKNGRRAQHDQGEGSRGNLLLLFMLKKKGEVNSYDKRNDNWRERRGSSVPNRGESGEEVSELI